MPNLKLPVVSIWSFVVSIVYLHFLGVLLGQEFFFLYPPLYGDDAPIILGQLCVFCSYCLPLCFLPPYVHSYFPFLLGVSRNFSISVLFICLSNVWVMALLLLLWVPVLLLNTKVSSPHIQVQHTSCLFHHCLFSCRFLCLFLQLLVIPIKKSPERTVYILYAT